MDKRFNRWKDATLIITDLLLICGAYYSAYLLRFAGEMTAEYRHIFAETLLFWVGVRFWCLHWFGLHRGIWRFTSSEDLLNILKGTGVSSLILVAGLVFYFGLDGFPRSVIILDFLMAVFLIGGVRFAYRVFSEKRGKRLSAREKDVRPRNILIVGAGSAGEMLAREIVRNPSMRINVVGFIDDDQRKAGKTLHGIPILGDRNKILPMVKRHHIEEILIAIPSLNSEQMRGIVKKCREANVRHKTLPKIYELSGEDVHLHHLRDVDIGDLLGRESVSLDHSAIENKMKGKRVLISGGGGSIGSELCRQALRYRPASLMVIDNSESALYDIKMELTEAKIQNDVEVECHVCDIKNSHKIENIFRSCSPHIVFHAAAYKHVPLMETDPEEAVLNNVLGTKTLADCAHKYNVDQFVMISTDKAVHPTSIMGATKRIAEMYVQGLSDESDVNFVTVRFGNVMNSKGSVIPLFRRQIARGGPVTVTHPEMKRYFMTIPEAVGLILQAASLDQEGIFVLDMGEPIKIADLAKEMVQVAGLSLNDIEIKFTGLRPGEKLFEDLQLDDEWLIPTAHQKIKIFQPRKANFEKLQRSIEKLCEAASRLIDETVREMLVLIARDYYPWKNRPDKKENVLLVDDDAIIQDLICTTLSHNGYNVDVASDGQEAVEMVKNKDYAVVILDINMPRKNGLEAFKEMKTIKKNLQAVVMSGCDANGYMEEAVRLGAAAKVEKPFKDVLEIFNLVENTLRYGKKTEGLIDTREYREKAA